MVRTKLCPKPFLASCNNTKVRIGNSTNHNGIKEKSFDLPMRVKLKARRRLTEKPLYQKLSEPSHNTNDLFESSPRFSRKNSIPISNSSRHKRQKSLHNILTTIHVNI